MAKLADIDSIDAFISGSNDVNDGAVRGMILGPSGAGKTFVATSLSEKYSTDDKGMPQPAELDDLVYISVDPGALRGLSQFGVTIPNVIDFPAMMQKVHTARREKQKSLGPNPVDSFLHAQKKLFEVFYAMQGRGYKRFVFDSLSVYGQLMGLYWRPRSLNKAESFDGMKYFMNLLTAHSDLSHTLLFAPGVDMLLTCHVKTINPTAEEAVDSKMTAMTASGAVDFVPDLEGSGLKHHIRPLDIAPYLSVTQQKGRPAVRKLSFVNAPGMTKNRFQHLISEMNGTSLRELFDKLAACR